MPFLENFNEGGSQSRIGQRQRAFIINVVVDLLPCYACDYRDPFTSGSARIFDAVANGGLDINASCEFGKFIKADSGPNEYANNRPQDAP